MNEDRLIPFIESGHPLPDVALCHHDALIAYCIDLTRGYE